MLTQQEIKKRLYYNPETGIFIKLLSTNHVKAGFKLPIENVEIVAKFAELITKPLEAEIARLRKDSERYQWLKKQLLMADFDYDNTGKSVLVFEMPDGIKYSSDLNYVIDQAIANKGEQNDE